PARPGRHAAPAGSSAQPEPADQRCPRAGRPSPARRAHSRARTLPGAVMPIFIDDLITTIQVELEAEQRVRDKAIAEIKYTLKPAPEQGRSALTAEEDQRVQDLFAARDGAKAKIAGIQSKLDQAQRAKAEELQAAEEQREDRASSVALPAPA